MTAAAADFTNRRYRHRGVVDEVERAKNRTKSKVRARVEHAIGVIKRGMHHVPGRLRLRSAELRGNIREPTFQLAPYVHPSFIGAVVRTAGGRARHRR